jgi:hypothetical protein
MKNKLWLYLAAGVVLFMWLSRSNGGQAQPSANGSAPAPTGPFGGIFGNFGSRFSEQPSIIVGPPPPPAQQIGRRQDLTPAQKIAIARNNPPPAPKSPSRTSAGSAKGWNKF